MGAEICGTPLLNRPPNSIQPYGTPAEQSFVLVVTNLRLALMLTRGDKDAEVLQQQQQERMNKLARNTPQASLPSRLPGSGDIHQARRDSAWVDARGRWESLCGVWNVIPLGMVLRVSLTDSSIHTSQPSKRSTRHNTSAPATPTLAPALPLFSPPTSPASFFSTRASKLPYSAPAHSHWMGSPSTSLPAHAHKTPSRRADDKNASESANMGVTVLSLECYDLRRVDLQFVSLDSAMRVHNLICSNPFSAERFLHLQLQEMLHEAIVAGMCVEHIYRCICIYMYFMCVI